MKEIKKKPFISAQNSDESNSSQQHDFKTKSREDKNQVKGHPSSIYKSTGVGFSPEVKPSNGKQAKCAKGNQDQGLNGINQKADLNGVIKLDQYSAMYP